MPGPKRQLPVEVVERAEALTKRYTLAPPGPTGTKPPVATLPAAAKKKKLVLALKKLHPMD
jgi:hypothetical protein